MYIVENHPDKVLTPHPNLYWFGVSVVGTALSLAGGCHAHNTEVFEQLQGQAFIIAAQHTSEFNPEEIGNKVAVHADRPIYYMAKPEVAHHPRFGTFLQWLGALPTTRGRGTGLEGKEEERVDGALKSGAIVLNFYQGSRKTPDKVFNTAAFKAMEHGLAVVGAAVVEYEASPVRQPSEIVFTEPTWPSIRSAGLTREQRNTEGKIMMKEIVDKITDANAVGQEYLSRRPLVRAINTTARIYAHLSQ